MSDGPKKTVRSRTGGTKEIGRVIEFGVPDQKKDPFSFWYHQWFDLRYSLQYEELIAFLRKPKAKSSPARTKEERHSMKEKAAERVKFVRSLYITAQRCLLASCDSSPPKSLPVELVSFLSQLLANEIDRPPEQLSRIFRVPGAPRNSQDMGKWKTLAVLIHNARSAGIYTGKVGTVTWLMDKFGLSERKTIDKWIKEFEREELTFDDYLSEFDFEHRKRELQEAVEKAGADYKALNTGPRRQGRRPHGGV